MHNFKPWPVWVADNKQQMQQQWIDSLPTREIIPDEGPPLETSNIISRLGSESIDSIH